MKKSKLIIPVFISVLTLTLTLIVSSATTTSDYTLITDRDSFISDSEYYGGELEYFKKGYYILRGNGDIEPFTFTKNIKSTVITKESFSLEEYLNIYSVEDKYLAPLQTAIEYLNDCQYYFENDNYLLIKAESYGVLSYNDDSEGCYNAYLFGVQIDDLDTDNPTGEKTHVVDVENHTTLEEILAKYTITDNVDSSTNLTTNIITVYNTGKLLGNYSLFIEVTDSSGNTSSTLDYIRVQDFIFPTITTEKDEFRYEVNSNITSEQIKSLFSFSDNYTEARFLVKTYDDNFKDQNTQLGTYSFTCHAKDQEGNVSSKTISIVIEDTTKPTISLKAGGDTILTNDDLSVDEIYDLLLIEDNYDTINKENVVITSTSTGIEGVEYEVTVTATDSNNNTATETFIYYINDTTPPNITVRDTIYLDQEHDYTTEELLAILKAAGLISNDAVTVNIAQKELVSSTKEEDVYNIVVEEILENGQTNYKNCTFRYQKPQKNILPFIIIPSAVLIGLVGIIIILKHKKHAHPNNN